MHKSHSREKPTLATNYGSYAERWQYIQIMANTKLNPKVYMYKRIVEAQLYIDSHYKENIDLNNISNQANFSKYHFLRLFKNAFGTSPHQYLTDKRISAAKKLLKENHSVSAVCFKVGFESIPSFVTLFKKI
ncbi:MAG: AraC family transcriptional regulator [Saonia sp.]